MVRFQTIFSNFLFLALIVLAGMSFIVVTQSDNEALQPISQDSLFNESFSDLESNLEGLESTSNTQFGQFTAEDPKPGFGSIVLFGIVSVGKTFGSVTITVFGILIKLPLVVLGIPATTITVLFTWLVVLMLIAAWRLYKLGG